MSTRFEPSQADKRRFTRLRDQHGRMWEGVIDINNGFPVGPLSLVGINAPLIPDQKFFVFPTLADGTFEIDYARWIEERENAKQVYEQRRIQYAQKMYGEQAGRMLKSNPVELQRSVGSEPDPVEPVLAASSGNQWILGLSVNKPDWAEQFFPTNPPPSATPSSDWDDEDLRDRFYDAEPEEDEGIIEE